MFKKILIANRGEIACRVMVTARRMGIQTVAVYSSADAAARHVALADEAVLIGPPPSRESYLRGEAIIAAAKATGAEAIHPGYGFLSENEAFARAVEQAGLAFIGPKAHSIAAMGDKIASKKLAEGAGVNTIPGHNQPIASPDDAVRIAQGIGYPVMIKASAGGGGKGLRVAWSDAECHAGFSACQSEARSSFGDDRVFMERFVEEPRHIEIQVLGDAHGQVVYLWERECSIQRRHQKVIEEAPSPFISEATRQAMGAQAVALAKAVQYQSAGTVEFVVGKDESFYFLEMNTRLQVEHPVTECITGLDLVEQMLRVAAGEPLAFTQADIRREGWAIECRINAEDPYRGFLPSTGRLVRFEPPTATLEAGVPTLQRGEIGGVRVDTGVAEGSEISMHYDSMIAKVIVHGRDRADAIDRMRAALDAFVVRGVQSNIPFQAALLAHPGFVAGQFNTGFIAAQYPQGFASGMVTPDDPLLLVALAAFVRRKVRERATGISGQVKGHGVHNGPDLVVVELGAGGQHTEHSVRLPVFDTAEGRADVVVGGRSYAIQSHWSLGARVLNGTVNGRPLCAQVDRGLPRQPLAVRITHLGAQLDALVLLPRNAELLRHMPHKPPPDMSKFLLSPMPGLLTRVAVTAGQVVSAGEPLAVIEAMKMENTLTAAQDGKVKAVLAQVGASLAVDQPILAFE